MTYLRAINVELLPKETTRRAINVEVVSAAEARIAQLEEALKNCLCARDWYEGHPEGALDEVEAQCKTLSQSSSDWLAKHDAEIRRQRKEECAKVADDGEFNFCTDHETGEETNPCLNSTIIAAAIRALPDEVNP